MSTPTFQATSPDRGASTVEQRYEHEETRNLVALVTEAAERVRAEGEAAFDELRRAGSRWRSDDTYIFVLNPDGRMLVHPDPDLEGHDVLDLEDVGGRPIIRGLIAAATSLPDKPEGWFHYQWPVPGGILPRWKSSYVKLVRAPTGVTYIVGGGMYDDRMERAFVLDMVATAVGSLERADEEALPLLRDSTGPFVAKDAYVFVMDMDGVEIVNPAFPTLEGTSLLDMRDTRGEPVVREMLDVIRTRGSGWVDYMWPRPGESLSTQKSTYVHAAALGGRPVVVGCGVYLADAPREAPPVPPMSARELVSLVREAATLLKREGEGAFAELRRPGSKWRHDDLHFFVWTVDGTAVFHAEDPGREGETVTGLTDALGRRFGRMLLEATASPAGEGWVHYMWPRPGGIFPAWKSCFAERVAFPSGKPRLVSAGAYDMRLDETLVEDLVDRAAALVESEGTDAFERLRDRKGPFVFMDAYVFVHTPAGIELVNPAFPSLEGRSLGDLRDVRGREVAREQASAALERGSAWLESRWYRPGVNAPARKRTYVRKAESGGEMYIVGSGIYVD